MGERYFINEIGVGEMGYEEEMMWDVIEEIKNQMGCQKKEG